MKKHIHTTASMHKLHTHKPVDEACTLTHHNSAYEHIVSKNHLCSTFQDMTPGAHCVFASPGSRRTFSFITVCCLEAWRPPLSPWADFQVPRALGRTHRELWSCSSLKNKDNLRDCWENPIPLLEKMRPTQSSRTPQGRRDVPRDQHWHTAWEASLKQGHRAEGEDLSWCNALLCIPQESQRKCCRTWV